ncbi:hypothetical protein Tco_0710853, partial [Tanacetum coccineum]
EAPLQNIITNSSISTCFKTLIPWNENFHLRDRLTWISIEGLPPQAWHEAAFTRIAGNLGEIIFPDKCDPKNNNLVSGKVCIRTKNMDFIQHNMPVIVDGVNICVRIREIHGECDEIFKDVPPGNTSLDDEDSSTNNDGNDGGHNNDDDDESLDEGFDDYDDFELDFGGGWVPESDAERNCESPNSSEFDNISLAQEKASENSKNPVNNNSQRMVTVDNMEGNYETSFPTNFLADTQIGDTSTCGIQNSLEVQIGDTLDSTAFVDLDTRDDRYICSDPNNSRSVSSLNTTDNNTIEPNTQNAPGSTSPLGLASTLSPCKIKPKPAIKKVETHVKTTRKNILLPKPKPTKNKFTTISSFKLIVPINGIKPRLSIY